MRPPLLWPVLREGDLIVLRRRPFALLSKLCKLELLICRLLFLLKQPQDLSPLVFWLP